MFHGKKTGVSTSAMVLGSDTFGKVVVGGGGKKLVDLACSHNLSTVCFQAIRNEHQGIS